MEIRFLVTESVILEPKISEQIEQKTQAIQQAPKPNQLTIFIVLLRAIMFTINVLATKS